MAEPESVAFNHTNIPELLSYISFGVLVFQITMFYITLIIFYKRFQNICTIIVQCFL